MGPVIKLALGMALTFGQNKKPVDSLCLVAGKEDMNRAYGGEYHLFLATTIGKLGRAYLATTPSLQKVKKYFSLAAVTSQFEPFF